MSNFTIVQCDVSARERSPRELVLRASPHEYDVTNGNWLTPTPTHSVETAGQSWIVDTVWPSED